MQYKNHEGYADPTAGAALMRAMLQEKRERRKHSPVPGRLTFRLGELESFKRCIERTRL